MEESETLGGEELCFSEDDWFKMRLEDRDEAGTVVVHDLNPSTVFLWAALVQASNSKALPRERWD